MKTLSLLFLLSGWAAMAAFAQEPCKVTQPTASWTIPYSQGEPPLDTDPASTLWQKAAATSMVKDCSRSLDYPKLKTEVRGFWTDTHLYLLFSCPYDKLNIFLPADHSKDRDKLYDRDVVEMFLGDDWEHIKRYREYEIAPTGDWMDLAIDVERRQYDKTWNSGWTTSARIDEEHHVWYAATRIPLASVTSKTVAAGTRWRINLYRIDGLGADPVRHFMCWQPTCVPAERDPNHVPENFGTMIFSK